MKISKPLSISFEFFPPKTPENMQFLKETSIALAKVSPQFFSVTFGAGGSTRAGTFETVKLIRQHTQIAVAPHIACMGMSKTELLEILTQYQSQGIKRLVALRGDLPSGMGQSGELKYAEDLVSLIREHSGNHFHIEVAAYPEFHPQAKNALDDIKNLQRKLLAGANSAITQYFYNPDAYFNLLEQCAKLNITAPIIPGIMPITNYHKLARFSMMCGAEIPQWIRKRLEAYADDHEAIKSFGLEVVYNLCQRLLEGGAPGFHFYTLNSEGVSLQLVKMLHLENQNKVVRIEETIM